MPHLAPMSWTYALMMIWTLITIMNTMNWWSTPTKFSFYNPSAPSLKNCPWTWYTSWPS